MAAKKKQPTATHRKQRLPVTTGWQWNASRDKAARLLAEGDLSIDEIAGVICVNQCTIDAWKKAPEFAARIEENIAAYRERFLRNGLAATERRLAKLSGLYRALEQEVEARGADMRKRKVVLGHTGLIAETWKQIGGGEDAQLVPEYSMDTATSREMRGVLEQIAKELGQWTEKKEVSGDLTLTVYDGNRLSELSDDELAQLTILARRIAAPAGPRSGGASAGAQPDIEVLPG